MKKNLIGLLVVAMLGGISYAGTGYVVKKSKSKRKHYVQRADPLSLVPVPCLPNGALGNATLNNGTLNVPYQVSCETVWNGAGCGFHLSSACFVMINGVWEIGDDGPDEYPALACGATGQGDYVWPNVFAGIPKGKVKVVYALQAGNQTLAQGQILTVNQ